MLKEETMEFKKYLDPEEFQNIAASDGWLEKWKLSYVIYLEWTCKDETGCFFKALPEKDLAEKESSKRGWKI